MNIQKYPSRSGASTQIDDLGLSVRTANALKAENIYYINDLIQIDVKKLRKIPRIGLTAVREIFQALWIGGYFLASDHEPEKQPKDITPNPLRDTFANSALPIALKYLIDEFKQDGVGEPFQWSMGEDEFTYEMTCVAAMAYKMADAMLEARNDGLPEGNRTPDNLLRRQVLYPTELRADKQIISNPDPNKSEEKGDTGSRPILAPYRRSRSSAQTIDALHIPEALLKIQTVKAVTGLSESSIRRKIAAGEFPAPITDGPRCSRWVAGQVTNWLKNKNRQKGSTS